MKYSVALLALMLGALLAFVLADKSEAKDILSYRLANGAVVVLTDEPCALTYKGKPLTGQRAYGQFKNRTDTSCWVQKSKKIFVIWYESESKEVGGITQYDTTDFKPVKTL